MAALKKTGFGLNSRSRPMTSEPTGIEKFEWEWNAGEDEQEAAKDQDSGTKSLQQDECWHGHSAWSNAVE